MSAVHAWPHPQLECDPRCRASWHERLLRRRRERAEREPRRQDASPEAPPPQHVNALHGTGPTVSVRSGSTSVRAVQVVAALPATSRKPGGRHRAGQRAPGRCPPNPGIPVVREVVLGVLRRTWMTPAGQPNVYRVRSLAALAAALAVPKGTTTTELCRMLPRDVRRLEVPKEGRRWLKRWFQIRAHWLDFIRDEATAWLALPPMSRGMPRMIGWGMTQTLHRAGAPAWRSRQLFAAGLPTIVVSAPRFAPSA
jgi:hypothetical protein